MSKQIRYYQQDAKNAVLSLLKKNENKGIKTTSCAIVLPTGCHARGTKILMHNGLVKNVEDIFPGDVLMGDDNNPRNVIQLARGREMMYEISPIKGESFVVNENHILSLKRTPVREKDARSYPEFINVTVKEYLGWCKSKKHLYKLHRKSVDFLNIGCSTHPYFIGLWLGDGTFNTTQITNPDIEIEEWLFGEFSEFCKWNHPEVSVKKREPKERCTYFDITTNNYSKQKNSLSSSLSEYKVNGEKRISSRLLRSCKENRLDLLAGLLDTDGYLNDSGFEIITKYDGLSEDILFLCRSLGFAAYKSKKTGEIKSLNFKGEYWRIFISGDCSIIPTKIKRKQSKKRLQKKDVLVSGFSVKEFGVDDFYGFSLDGNHLYLTADFTVHHNTGKTFTCVNTIKEMGRKLFIAHTEELIEQSAIALIAELELMPYNELILTIHNHGGLFELVKANGLFLSSQAALIKESVGVIKADLFDIDKPIVVASAQTLHRRLERIPCDHFEVVVADECDLFGAASFLKSIKYFTPKLLLGLTATFFRMDNMPLTDIFDEVAYEYPLDKAVKEGYLCKPEAIQLKTNTDIDSIHTVGGDFNQGELTIKVNTPERNFQIVNAYLKYGEGRQFIAFCTDVQHAIDLTDCFKEKGVICDYIVGDKELTTDRKGTINKFKSGETTGLCNVMVLSVGFDYPDTGMCIMACPTKSRRKFLQQIGRGFRLKSALFVEKWGQKVIILDVVDTTTKHKLVNTKELDRELPLEDKIFISEENRQKLLAVKAARETKISIAVRQEDTKVDLFELPVVKISTSKRMEEPATEKQLAWIARLGYDIINVNYTKKMCSEIISMQPASDSQVWRLKKEGYDVSNGVTVAEASAAFKEIEERAFQKQSNNITKGINSPFKF